MTSAGPTLGKRQIDFGIQLVMADRFANWSVERFSYQITVGMDITVGYIKGIQLRDTTEGYNRGIQGRDTTEVYNSGIQQWHIA